MDENCGNSFNTYLLNHNIIKNSFSNPHKLDKSPDQKYF